MLTHLMSCSMVQGWHGGMHQNVVTASIGRISSFLIAVMSHPTKASMIAALTICQRQCHAVHRRHTLASSDRLRKGHLMDQEFGMTSCCNMLHTWMTMVMSWEIRKM